MPNGLECKTSVSVDFNPASPFPPCPCPLKQLTIVVLLPSAACFEESADLPCFHTGQDVLDKYSFNEANLYRNLWAIVVIYLFFHLLGYFFLWRRARKI